MGGCLSKRGLNKQRTDYQIMSEYDIIK